MNVSVERYQRRKYVSQENSPMLYYVRQKSGTVRVMDVEKLADAIEANSSLTAGDVKHAIEAFVEQLRLSLTQGDKVKIDGLGTFHITLCSEGTEKEKDCTVRSIRRVNVRFVADKALHLVNASHTSTRSENNVEFVLASKGDTEGGNAGGEMLDKIIEIIMTILPFLGNRKKRKAMAQDVKEFSELVKDQYTFLMEQLEKVLKDYFDLSARVKEMHTEIFSLREQLAQAATLQCVNKECLQRTQSEASISEA